MIVTTGSVTTSVTASASEIPTHSSTTSIQPSSVGHLVSPITGMTCLSLVLGGMLIL
jgi:hypothetical protein